MAWILKKYYAALIVLLLIAIVIPGCTLPVSTSTPVEGIVYPAEVPASFEAVIAYRAVNPAGAPVKYQWLADNGTIKGEGTNVIWEAPAIPGKYGVSVKVTDAAGNETDSHVNIDVIPFSKNTVDANPEIVLNVPSPGNAFDGLQVCMGPMTTAVIACPAADATVNTYTYAWSCNGGRMHGQGIKEGIADKIGWTSPGMAGNYTVKVMATDGVGNLSIGHVYVNVKQPSCCATPDNEDIIQWKK